jgi:hypothetical protein
LFQTLPNDELERRGAVVIASNWGTEDLGSNPARVQGFYENISMLLCIVTKCALFVWFKLEINVSAQKYFKRSFSTIDFRLMLEYLRYVHKSKIMDVSLRVGTLYWLVNEKSKNFITFLFSSVKKRFSQDKRDNWSVRA